MIFVKHIFDFFSQTTLQILMKFGSYMLVIFCIFSNSYIFFSETTNQNSFIYHGLLLFLIRVCDDHSATWHFYYCIRCSCQTIDISWKITQYLFPYLFFHYQLIMFQAGANLIVSGSAVMKSTNPRETIQILRCAVNEAMQKANLER